MYQLLRSLLFLFDPEKVHYFSMTALKSLCSIGFIKNAITKYYSCSDAVGVSLFNIRFPNKVGLGAGFDKNAQYLDELEAIGFGFVEIGTVTPLPQEGNEKPRVFRLPADKALVNRMGFNNDGADRIAKRLKSWREQSSHTSKKRLIIGGNIGKNKATPNEDAWKDYKACFKALNPYVDYFVVNVSSPNTPGLRELQDKESLRTIFTALENENKLLDSRKPILLKIAPDLSDPQIDDVISLAMEINLDGLVACNTTIARDGLMTPSRVITRIGAGGLSGLPVQQRSTSITRYIRQKTAGQIPIIASGGIFTGRDAAEKLDAGASLVQVWTGFIYEGPGIVKKICKTIGKK